VNGRIGEWADSGLLKPLDFKDEFKAKYLPMSWDALTHKQLGLYADHDFTAHDSA
jgi:maltose-binding protein MalE